MAKSKEDLQSDLDTLHSYCDYKDLHINIAKTKIVFLSGDISSFHVNLPLSNLQKLD